MLRERAERGERLAAEAEGVQRREIVKGGELGGVVLQRFNKSGKGGAAEEAKCMSA